MLFMLSLYRYAIHIYMFYSTLYAFPYMLCFISILNICLYKCSSDSFGFQVPSATGNSCHWESTASLQLAKTSNSL